MNMICKLWPAGSKLLTSMCIYRFYWLHFLAQHCCLLLVCHDPCDHSYATTFRIHSTLLVYTEVNVTFVNWKSAGYWLTRPWQRQGEISSIVWTTPWSSRLIAWFAVLPFKTSTKSTLYESELFGCVCDSIESKWVREGFVWQMEKEEDDAAVILLHPRKQGTSMIWAISRWPDLGGATKGGVASKVSSCWYLWWDQKWILQTPIYQ